MESGVEPLADEIVAYLHDAISVDLIGLHGSGRTRTVQIVADRLRELGHRVTVLRGVAALRDRPLAVLGVAGVDITSPSPALAIPHAVEALSALLASRPVLLIDDADDLDAASAGVVAAAHAERGFPVLTVTRPGSRQRSPNHALIGALQPGVRLRAEPLGFDQLHRVVHEMLPGPVEPSTVAQIATMSGGLPGLVQAIVETGRRTGAIARERTVWRAKACLWDPRLAQAVEPLLAVLDDDESAALAQLSYAGSVPLDEARELVTDAVYTRLDELGLLETVSTPMGPLVGVFPPLAAESFRHARASKPRPGAPGAPGAPRRPLPSPLVAALNVRILDHWRAEVAALRAVWQADPTPANATALVTALNGASAGPDEFAAVFAGTRPGAPDSRDAVLLLGWESLYRGLVLRDVENALALLWERRAIAPQYAAQLAAFASAVTLSSGAIPGDDILVPPGSHHEPTALESLDLARRVVLVYAGRTADAMDGLPGTVPDLSHAAETYCAVVGLSYVFNGDCDTGIDWALRVMADAQDRLDPGQILVYAYIAALGMMFSGRLDEAQNLLDAVLALTGPTMVHEYYHAGVLGLAALAAGWRGRTGYAGTLTAQAVAGEKRSGPFPDILRAGTPGECLWDVVAERFATGHIAAGISMAVEAVETCPPDARAAIAAEYALRTQSPFFNALGHYIEAVVAADPERLGACVAELRGLGTTLYAVKAGVSRALVLRTQGALAESIRQSEDAWAEAGTRGPVPVGLFRPLGQAVGFGPREREIARLLADGLTSQAIATMLGLSYRTVENYLSSAYRKLGSTGRADLIRAITTWAATD